MSNADFYRACAQANIQEKDLKLLVKRVLGDVRILGVLNESERTWSWTIWFSDPFFQDMQRNMTIACRKSTYL